MNKNYSIYSFSFGPNRIIYQNGPTVSPDVQGQQETPEKRFAENEKLARNNIQGLKEAGFKVNAKAIDATIAELRKNTDVNQMDQLAKRLYVCNAAAREISSAIEKKYVSNAVLVEMKTKVQQMIDSPYLTQDFDTEKPADEETVSDITGQLLEVAYINRLLTDIYRPFRKEARDILEQAKNDPSKAEGLKFEAENLAEVAKSAQAEAVLELPETKQGIQTQIQELKDFGYRIDSARIEKTLTQLDTKENEEQLDQTQELNRRLYVCLKAAQEITYAKEGGYVSDAFLARMKAQLQSRVAPYLAENLSLEGTVNEKSVTDITGQLMDTAYIDRLLKNPNEEDKAEAEKIRQEVKNNPSLSADNRDAAFAISQRSQGINPVIFGIGSGIEPMGRL